jgi:hypothetical protein
MNTLQASLLAAAALLFTSSANAADLTKVEYKDAGKSIDADFDAAKQRCRALAGNASDVCTAEAKGNKNIAETELEYRYQPTAKHRRSARIARADAVYGVAIQKCDGLAGNDKDVCVKQAKAAKVASVADADTELTTMKALGDLNTSKNDANLKANDAVAGARIDGAKAKRDADYAVAKEKCQAQAGAARETCVNEAKSRFGQN